MKDFLEFMLILVFVSFIAVGSAYKGANHEHNRLINELCQHQQYDFCVAGVQTYSLKGEENGR